MDLNLRLVILKRVKILKQIEAIDPDEQFVITGGVPMGIAGTTNYLSIQIYN